MKEPVIKIQKQRDLRNTRPIYIAADLHAAIKQLSQDTHVPMSRIIDKLLCHGLEYIEIIGLDGNEQSKDGDNE